MDMQLSEYLKLHRIRQKDLAAQLGVSEGAVSSWVAGRHIPEGRKLAALVKITEGAVTVSDFADHVGTSAKPLNPTTSPRTSPPGLAEAQSSFLQEARALGLDPDAIAAAALKKAIGDEKARRWNEEHREAFEAWHRWVEENGLPLDEYRMF